MLINYREEVVGKYADGAKARQEFANLTIVDLVSDTQYKSRVDGPEPPLKKVGSGDKSGGSVYSADVSRCLEKLPRVRANK